MRSSEVFFAASTANKGNVEKATGEFDKAITGSLEKADAANKAVVDDINARAEKYYREIEPEAPGTSETVDTLEFNRITNLNEDVDNPILDNFAEVHQGIQGRANDADLDLISELANMDDLKVKVITEDVTDLQKVISDRILGVFGKIQEPKSRAMVAAMSSKIIERHGFEFMDADLQDAFRTYLSGQMSNQLTWCCGHAGTCSKSNTSKSSPNWTARSTRVPSTRSCFPALKMLMTFA